MRKELYIELRSGTIDPAKNTSTLSFSVIVKIPCTESNKLDFQEISKEDLKRIFELAVDKEEYQGECRLK